jgi:hypothetical protein
MAAPVHPAVSAVEKFPARDHPVIVTDIFDMKLRSLKTVTALEIGTMSEDVKAAIDYRYEANQVFATTPYKNLHVNGVVTFPVTAIEFRIRIWFKNQDDIDLSYILVRWKMTDKRTVRGTYAEVDKAISRTGG